MKDLIAVIDLGKSLIKVIYYLPATGQTKFLRLDTELAELSSSELQKMSRAASEPEDDAWLELTDGTGMGVALGFLAATRYQHRSDNKRTQLKHITAVLRCMAVIGAIAQKERLGEDYSDFQDYSPHQPNHIHGKTLSVAISVLLPFGEFSNQQSLLEALASGLRKFCFRGTNYSIEASALESDIKPEGAGQLLLRQSQLSLANFRRRNILCLIMSHYNGNRYALSQGTAQQGRKSGLWISLNY